MKMSNAYVRRIISFFEKTGSVAIYHPRKHTVSINGFPAIPVEEAVSKMLKIIFQ